MRMRVRGPAMTLDAIPIEESVEPTGLRRDVASHQGSGPARFVAQLPGSPADYFVTKSGDGSGRTDLWEVAHELADPGTIYPQSEADRLEAQRDADRRVRDADRHFRRVTGDTAAERAAGLRLGRATRARDTTALRLANARSRARYGS